ncbi:hypothetical protein THAOC_14422 [Thalassiosira oceanica]|uniref:Uncharacterized protein n=1 Tax=Thalassiosira oceanica TaxID=159749 RepID=K0T304_THAOC|nr:hypothetical protein THAOC_14422 [Thalassiosira oceanica]|eukprot:EJK64807.1 hypothetical protein THAOC_14422 [Thalassiosira oceanica]
MSVLHMSLGLHFVQKQVSWHQHDRYRMNERDTSTLRRRRRKTNGATASKDQRSSRRGRHEQAAARVVAVKRPTELRRRKTNGAPAGGGREEEDTPYDGAASTKTTAAYAAERPTELRRRKTNGAPAGGGREEEDTPYDGATPGDSIPEKPGAGGAVGRCGVGVAGAGAGTVGVSLGRAVEDPTHSCVRYKGPTPEEAAATCAVRAATCRANHSDTVTTDGTPTNTDDRVGFHNTPRKKDTARPARIRPISEWILLLCALCNCGVGTRCPPNNSLLACNVLYTWPPHT